MEIANVRGEPRQGAGKHANRRLRRGGMVPSVIYGHGEAPETVALSLHDLEMALHHQQHVIRLDSNEAQRQYLIKEVQYDHLQQTPVHVDLMRVDPNERVQVRVPVELRGTPKGAHEGGILVNVMTDVEVDCPLLKIPDQIGMSITHLELGASLQVSDLPFPEDVKPVSKPDDIVAVIRARRGVELEVEEQEVIEEAGAAEPEVIGRGPKEGEEGAAGGA